MQCPQCHEENPDKAKFCLNCGAKLAAVCPQCGAELPPAAKFCFECGTPLLSPPAPSPLPQGGRGEGVPPQAAGERGEVVQRSVAGPVDLAEHLKRLVPKEFAERLLATKGQVGGERRLVTILFSDVKGSTAMAENLDPEDVMDIMNGAFEFLIAPVYRHEGTLARLMGDAILAFFGAPIAHEDDPERAIRAALEIIAGAREYAARLEKERKIKGFNVRVGINTGLVVVGEVGSDLRVEYTAMGDAINTAARMEQAAPVGGVLISHDTYQHVRGLFEVQALEPVSVKGKAEPVQVYVVHRAKPRGFRLPTRGVEGIETHMVGREGELKKLQDAFYIALEDRERQMATITGEAGVGKSRLLYEFESWLDLQPQRIRYFRGRASQELLNVPYALLRDLFIFDLEIQESDPPRAVREKLEHGLGEVLGEDERGQMKAHLIGQLLGFDFSDSPHLQGVLGDAKQLRDRALIYLTEFFQSSAAVATAVILMEDIHWADDSSLDAINQLAQALPEQRLLLICLARPPLFDRRPHWGEGQPFHLHLELQPLSRRDSRRLVEEILQRVDDMPAALRELIVGGAEGNPLYVEELIKVLIEEGIVVKGEERWRVEASRLAEMRVPPTLTGVLQARLDSLPLEQRAILQQAAVVGRTFWDRIVVRIGEATGEAKVDQVPVVLSALRGREMVAQRETSAFAGTQEFIFKHAALREVAYESILKKIRRGYHALVAEWLIEQGGERTSEYTGLIAEHLDLGGDAERALIYLHRAGEQAVAHYANAEAVRYLSRALELTPEGESAERYALLLAREKAYDVQGAREAQAQDLAALEGLAETLANDWKRAEVALRRACYHEAISDFPAAQAAAEQAVGWASLASDPHLEVEGLIAWARAHWRQGQLPEAQEQLEQALALARQSDDQPGEAGSRHYLGTVRLLRGDLQSARDHLEQALVLRRALGDRRSEAISLGNLVAVYDGLGDFSRGKTCCEQALAIYQTIGDRRGEAQVLSNLASNYLALGDPLSARDYHARALALCQAVGDRRGEALAAKNLGLVLHELGDNTAARHYCEQALEINRATGDRGGEAYSLTHLALALEGLGELETAAATYEQALKLRRELGQSARAIDDLAGLVRVALKKTQTEQALAYAEEVLAWVQDRGVGGIDYPLQVYSACVDALTASSQPERARALLQEAHTLLDERAARISDPATRRAFLENVPLHRQIRERLAQQ